MAQNKENHLGNAPDLQAQHIQRSMPEHQKSQKISLALIVSQMGGIYHICSPLPHDPQPVVIRWVDWNNSVGVFEIKLCEESPQCQPS